MFFSIMILNICVENERERERENVQKLCVPESKVFQSGTVSKEVILKSYLSLSPSAYQGRVFPLSKIVRLALLEGES